MAENENIINEKILITIFHENCFHILKYYIQLNEIGIEYFYINHFLNAYVGMCWKVSVFYLFFFKGCFEQLKDQGQWNENRKFVKIKFPIKLSFSDL